mmetsp:Transcript_49544/g.105283  ORF Transcript_49544/g.105283 Transcript_49544/m.105283 type:complete len:85 (-) Transcript_49544:224-478(-)
MGRGGTGEEREAGASDSRTGTEPDQLALWMEVLEAGIMCAANLDLLPLIVTTFDDTSFHSPTVIKQDLSCISRGERCVVIIMNK